MNMNDKYEEIIAEFVFLSPLDFKNKVNEMIMKQLTEIKSEKLDEHVIKNHIQQIIELKDKAIKIEDNDSLLESAIRIFKAIDNIQVFNSDTLLNEVAKQESDDTIHWALSSDVFFTYYKDDKDVLIKPSLLSSQEAKILCEFLKTVLK